MLLDPPLTLYKGHKTPLSRRQTPVRAAGLQPVFSLQNAQNLTAANAVTASVIASGSMSAGGISAASNHQLDQRSVKGSLLPLLVSVTREEQSEIILKTRA